MPKRSNNRSKRGGSKRKNKNSRVARTNTMPVRVVPATWDPAVQDSRPMATPKREPPHTFRRTFTAGTLQANTGDTLYAYNFQLSSLPNSSEYTNLYDQYRVLEIVLSFMPYNSMGTGANSPGLVGHWIDYDDSNLPANLQEGQQYDTYQRNPCTDEFVRVIKPKSAVASYSGAFTSYDSVYGKWHDTNSPNIQHYGLKLCIHGATYSTATNIYEVEATVTLQCKSQH